MDRLITWFTDWLKGLFYAMPCPPDERSEVEDLLAELITIGKGDDFLSEHPGNGFNGQCRHIRTIQIGRRLHDIGGLPLMEWTRFKIKQKIKMQLASHLDYAWDGVGDWRA